MSIYSYSQQAFLLAKLLCFYSFNKVFLPEVDLSFKPVPEEFRKIAVLSMEIQGTALSRHRELLLSELTSCVSVCGGETRQMGPNSIIALFGTGRNTEQACRRAVDCGFRMMKTISLVNKSIETGITSFTGKAGITSEGAPVDLRGQSEAENTENGIANCIELMSKAEPGTILVSEEAKVSCGGFCTWESNGTGSWIPGEKKDQLTIHPLLMGVPLLGRVRETEHLTAALNSFRKWHGHPPVLVLGKPGIGKTRLIEDFLGRNDGPATKIVRLTNRLWDQPPLGMWNPLMEKGTFDPYGTVMAQVRQITAERELIICIEDLHWGDEASIKLLEQLSQALCDSGAFLILSSRTKLSGSMESKVEKLTVEGLGQSAVKELIDCILGRSTGSESERFTDFLMTRTAGNPLLVIELVLHYMESGAVGRDISGRWFIRREPEDIIPLSAESFLQARMSTLNPQERFALQVASVLGNTFEENHFTEIFTELGYESGGIILARLVNMGFLNSPASSTLVFSNTILAGTVYRTIVRENRILIHKTAAEILSGKEGMDPAGTGAIALARHWIESETGEKAVPWLMNALSQCLNLGDVLRAETLSRELHRRTPGGSGQLEFNDARLQLIMGKFQIAHDSISRIIHTLEGSDLAMAFFLKGQATENLGLPLKEAIELYEKASAAAESAGDMNIKAQALSAAGSVYLAIGNRQKGLDSFSRALEQKDALDTPSLAKLHGNMGILMHRTGSHEEALKHYMTTLDLGRKCGNLSIEANALAFIGQVEINMGRRESGLEKYREALSIHRKAGNRRGECITLGNLGGQLARFGDTESAVDMLEKAIHIAEDIGHTRGIMSFHSNLGLAHKMAGNYEDAEKHIKTAMDMIAKSGDKRAMAVAHLNLCTVLSNMNRLGEAVEEARRALRFACRVNALTTQSRALGNLGWLMLKTDRLEMAINFFRESYRRSFLAEDHSMLADSKVGEGRAFFELGKLDESGKCFKDAERLSKEYGIDYEARAGYMELENLLKETGYGKNS